MFDASTVFSDFVTGVNNLLTWMGLRTYTEQNYVTDDESLTDSVDALDIALNDTATSLGKIKFESVAIGSVSTSAQRSITLANAYVQYSVVAVPVGGSPDSISITKIQEVDRSLGTLTVYLSAATSTAYRFSFVYLAQ